MEIKYQIKKYLADNVIMVSRAIDIGDDASFLERNLLDSTGVLELVAFLEDTFQIKVDDRDILPENLDSLNRIVAYIDRKRGAHEQAA